jgi:hypothetical protein
LPSDAGHGLISFINESLLPPHSREGKDWAGRCPFHEDDTASLVVTPAKNLWHCFGCQSGGGPVDWVMKLKGVSFRHAVELLKEDSSLAAEGSAPKRSSVRTLAAPVAVDADDRAMLRQVVDYYHQSLKDYNIRWLLRAIVRLGLKGLFAVLVGLLAWLRVALETAPGLEKPGMPTTVGACG